MQTTTQLAVTVLIIMVLSTAQEPTEAVMEEEVTLEDTVRDTEEALMDRSTDVCDLFSSFKATNSLDRFVL